MPLSLSQIKLDLKEILAEDIQLSDLKNLKLIFNLLDLTSLNTEDNYSRIADICKTLKSIHQYMPELDHIAGFVVFPIYIKTLDKLLYNSNIKKVTVAGNFPYSQSSVEVALQEIAYSLNEGADEIDIVLSPGAMFQGNYKKCSMYINESKKICNNIPLKVILETGVLQDECLIEDAAYLAMEAGTDFIKTSTGKTKRGASFEAIYIMSHCIKNFNKENQRKVGIKPAGGVGQYQTACQYIHIIKQILGEEWINSKYTRIGASSLLDSIILEYGKLAGRKIIPEILMTRNQ